MMDEKMRREMIANMTPEQKVRAVEIALSVREAIECENRYRAMTNDELVNELITGPWAEVSMFTPWSSLLDVVIERLRSGEG